MLLRGTAAGAPPLRGAPPSRRRPRSGVPIGVAPGSRSPRDECRGGPRSLLRVTRLAVLRALAQLPRLASMSTLRRGIARRSDMQILRLSSPDSVDAADAKGDEARPPWGPLRDGAWRRHRLTSGETRWSPHCFWMLREIPRTRDTASACCCRTRDELHVGGLTAIILRREREGAALFFFQAVDGIRDLAVTGVQTCALPI